MVEIVRTKLQDHENPNWQALDEILWKKVIDPYPRWGNGVSYHPRDHVRLSEEDWKQIQRLVVEREIPVTMCNTNFGFSVGMTLWKPAEFAWATMVEPAQPITTIPAVCLPSYDRGKSFDLGWKKFSPLTHSEANQKLLERNKLEAQREKLHYAY
jgi:hypothetical protein